jgi:hypothetical protein
VLPPDLTADVHRVLADLRRAHLAETAWPAVAGDLARLASAVGQGDERTVRSALLPLTQAAFEGKVRGRLAAADRRAAVVTATKPTPSLPLVGAVCGLLLLGLGYLIGGGLVLAGTVVFGFFIFGVAVAGSRTNVDRLEERRSRRLSPTRELTEPAPPIVVEALARIEAQLGPRRAGGGAG